MLKIPRQFLFQLDGDDASGGAGNDPADAAGGGDWETRYKGVNKTLSTRTNELVKIRNDYENAVAAHSNEKSKLETDLADYKRQLAEWERKYGEKEHETQTLSQQAAQLAAKEREFVSVLDFVKENPELADLYKAGDLKKLSDFQTADDYNAYLKRMAEKVGSGKRETERKQKDAERQVPPSGAGTRPDQNDMTDQEVQDWLFDHRPEEDPVKYNEMMGRLLSFK